MRISNSIPPGPQADLPAAGTSSIDTGDTVDEYLEQLREKYSDLKIHITDITSKEQIKSTALSRPGSFHVFIDSGILELMARDTKSREKYEGILGQLAGQQKQLLQDLHDSGKEVLSSGAVIDGEGKFSLYAATVERQKDAFISAGRNEPASPGQDKKDFTSPIQFHYKYNCGRQMARLAQARSISNVRGVINSQYNEMSQVRRTIKDKSEAAITLRRIKNVIAKGNLKISRLHKEEALAARCRIAQKHQQAGQEQHLRQELRAKRLARKAQEHCDTFDFLGLLTEKTRNSQRENDISFPAEGNVDACSASQVSVPGEVSVEVEIVTSMDITV